jgi:2,4-dienoyl-CoA reductase-like NADH-dependent reductase (Old Yellow Enzyme family)
MDADDIASMIDYHARCAVTRRRRFGRIEIQKRDGYLLHQFLSPHFNYRTGHGGSPENRMRFGVGVLTCARRSVRPGRGRLRLAGD